MQLTFQDVKIDQENGVWLCLKVKEQPQAFKFVMNKKDKEYTAKIQEVRQHRSLDANALYWKLCGMLSKELGYTSDEIYLRHIKELSNYEVLCMEEGTLEAFERMWKSNHLGRFIETRKSKIPGCVTVLAYYGSSDFNKREMSILIDNCIQDCQAVGIETLPDDQLSLIKESWGSEEDT
mgnify:CR=1 FL=1